jgi:hypothetical protein
MIENVTELTDEQIETVEKLTLRWIFQAVMDFGFEAYTIFYQSPDEVKDVAEDITRELLDRLSGYNIQQRVYGNVDYKRARYIILPEEIIRQALFVDSKAEKEGRTAWLAGRNAPSLGEDFRVRLAFSELKKKSRWRVQRIDYEPQDQSIRGTWDD